MFIANTPDLKKFPPSIRLPHCPVNDEYFSDSDDEVQPEFTLRTIENEFANLLSLDY